MTTTRRMRIRENLVGIGSYDLELQCGSYTSLVQLAMAAFVLKQLIIFSTLAGLGLNMHPVPCSQIVRGDTEKIGSLEILSSAVFTETIPMRLLLNKPHSINLTQHMFLFIQSLKILQAASPGRDLHVSCFCFYFDNIRLYFYVLLRCSPTHPI